MLCFPALLLLALPHSSAGDPSQAPVVLRSYDLSSAVPFQAQQPQGARLFPLLVDSSWSGLFEHEMSGGGAEMLVELARDAWAEEFQQPDRVLMLDEHQRLVVRAPEAVHKGVAQLIAFWEQAFATGTELVIDVALAERPPAAFAPALVGPAEADKLLASWGGGARRQSYRLRIAPGALGTLEDARLIDVVPEFNCEIAQSSAVLDPVTEQVQTGLRLCARTAPAPGGQWLALAAGWSEAAGALREDALRVSAMLVSDKGSETLSMGARIQGLDIEARSFALNAFLPEGRVLLLQTATQVQAAHSAALVAIRAAGPAPQRELQLALEGLEERGRFQVHNGQFAFPPRVLLASENLGGLSQPECLLRGNDVQAHLTAQLFPPNFEPLHSLLDYEYSMLTNWEPFLILRRSVDGSAETPPGNPDFALVLSRLCPSPRMFQVTLHLRRAGTEPVSVARAVVPLRLGETSAVVLGAESHRLIDYDVEVAQNASVSDPVVVDSFDGAVFQVSAQVGLRGEVLVQLQGLGRVQRTAWTEFDARSPVGGPVSQASFDFVQWRERLSFAKDGAKLAVLGDSGGRGLVLEVEALELR